MAVLTLNAKTNGNPLAADPTRTATLRREFEGDCARRFDRLKRLITQLIVHEDAFGLKESPALLSLRRFTQPITNTRWKFNTSQQKLEEFQGWLAQQVEGEILSSPGETTDDWWQKYIDAGYKKGAGRSFDDVNKPYLQGSTDFYAGTKAQFLQDSFGQPATIEKVKLLGARVFTDLKGVTDTMAAQIGRELTDGLVRGASPYDIARKINERVSVGKSRSETIARTEVIRAHAEGQLDALEAMGVDELGIMVEWSTSGVGTTKKGNASPCKLCAPLKGIVIKTSEAHGLLPRHPNCMCAFIPANVGESQEKQKRGPVQISEARNDSIKAERPKNSKATLEQLKAATPWAGADTKFSKLRPKSILHEPSEKDLKAVAKKEAEAKALKEKEENEKAIAEKAAQAAQEAAEKAAKDAQEAADKAAKAEAARLAAEAAEKARVEAERILREEQERKARELKEEAVKREKAGKLPQLAELEKIKSLPGSTHPDLMKNKYTDKQWVMKSVGAGLSPDHLRSEALADNLYGILGLDVPRSGIVESAEGPAKLAEFLEGGETLSSWMAGRSAVEHEGMFKQIQKGFVADALLANHDVAGLSNDNIFIVGGKPYRIDNGGALTFRAQGAPKRDFGAVVKELEGLRDPKLNANTAAIFKSLTDDDIDLQIQSVLSKRTKLLLATDDIGLKVILSDRLDNLDLHRETRLKAKAPTPSAGGVTAEARARDRRAEPGILRDTAERVKKARINGVTIKGDRGDIEDLNILAWEETVNGNPVTKIQLKVTPEGSRKIQEKLKDELNALPSATGQSSSVHPKDTYWNTIEKGVKTVAKHATDKQYNKDTIKELEGTLKELIAAKAAAGPDDKKMFTHYHIAVSHILNAKDLGEVPSQIQQYVNAPTPVAPSERRADARARKEQIQFGVAEFENGRAKRKVGQVNRVSGEQYTLDYDDDTQIKYHASQTGREKREGLAYEGNIEITIPGEASAETLQAAMGKLKGMGIDPTPPTAAYEELTYLHRSVYLRNDHELKEYKTIVDSSVKDETKIEKIKKWAGKRYGVDFTQGYDPEGKVNGFGDGYRHWERWDLTRETIEKELKGYTLQHGIGGGDIAKTLDAVLQSGGEMTSTVQRIRKGVPIQGAGVSSTSDLETGGASYLFTRITPPGESRGQLRFKIGVLARQDAVSYSGDKYGRIEDFELRKSTIEEYQRVAQVSNNETIFKHNLNLLHDIDHITTHSSYERHQILEVFKKNKITHLPDGRSIEDIVE